MTLKHTPGPWVWDSTVWDYDPKEDAPWLVTEASGDRILHGEIQCPSEANAHLIAAAPYLLAALLMIKDAAIEQRGLNFNLTTEQWAVFHAAIAKATGETQ